MLNRRTFISLFSALFFILYSACSQAEVMLEKLDGTSVPFSSLKGKWVFINYWASWCNPCVDEISELNRFYQKKTDKVAVFAVNYDGLPLYKQQRLTRKYGIHYPGIKNKSADQLHLGDISAIPATFVFNPQGQYVTTLYGGQTFASLSEVMG